MNLANCAVIAAFGIGLISTQAGAQQHETQMQGQSHAADSDMKAGMEKMNHEMGGASMSGNPDQDFVAMMIPHHQGAIDMAQAELRHGKDPAVRQLAKDIVAAQEKEIAMMKHWQSTHHGH